MCAGTYRINTTETEHREVKVMTIDIDVHACGGRRRLRLAALTTALALCTAAPASAAGPAVNRLISWQYQAKSGDTATMAGIAALAGPRAHRSGSHGLSTTQYLARNSRYQFQSPSIPFSAQSPGYVVNPQRAISVSVPLNIHLRSGRQISGRDALTHDPRAISSGDARLLLRLGLGLALAYLVFLAVWFWRTRNSTEGAAARVVRF